MSSATQHLASMARQVQKRGSRRTNYMAKQRQASLKPGIVNDKPVPKIVEDQTAKLYERQLQNWDD